MSDYGISTTGFKRKRLDLLLNELNAEVKAIFGDNFNISPESPDGQINGVISGSNADLWEIAEASYNAFNPSAASGVALSNLVQLNGIERLAATPSTVTLTLYGTPGTIIAASSSFSTVDTADTFLTDREAVIGLGGSVTIKATASSTGPIGAVSGSITEINNPISGLSSVTNLEDAVEGRDEETDVELRARRARSVAKNSQSIIEAIFANVADVTGVTQTVVLENDTEVVDTNGLPPHSFQVIVVGGADEEIGDAIWLKKPAGIMSFGNTTVQITDSQGISHGISFSRPIEVDIYVEVTLNKFADYPAKGDDLIKQAIVDYANGILVTGRGFSLADDVIYSRLYTPINSVQGHEITDLRIGTSPSPTGSANIAIGPTEVSNFLVANIVVN